MIFDIFLMFIRPFIRLFLKGRITLKYSKSYELKQILFHHGPTRVK